MESHWRVRAAWAAVAMLWVGCASAQTKIATLDLTPYGVMTEQELDAQHPVLDPEPKYVGWLTSGPKGGIAWNGLGAVAIDGQGHVYAGLPIWATDYAPKNPLRGQGNKLRVLVVGAAGKVAQTFDFPTDSLDRLDLRTAADGTLLVLANDKLTRVGADGKPTAQLDVPNEQKEYEVWDVTGSTTGRTLRIWLNNTHTLFVDAQTLIQLKDCHHPEKGPESDNDSGSMTDKIELSSEAETPFPDAVYGLEKEAFCQPRERLTQFGATHAAPSVVDDERFLAVDGSVLSLRKMTGETVWTSKPPEGKLLDAWERAAQVSRDGKRVAIRLLRQFQRQEPDSMNPEDIRNGTWHRKTTVSLEDSIGLWDMATGRLVARVPLASHDVGRFSSPYTQFAISPDGHLLAVLADGKLTLWKID